MSASEAERILMTLREREPKQGLAPKRVWDEALSERIMRLPLEAGAEEAAALRSALLLWNDDLDRSHTLSQELHTPTGSLLHGIMHRMEGDYGNAAYWFRLAGTHPCYGSLAGMAPGEAWDPFAFNRAVERAVRGGDEAEASALRERQHAEMSAVAAYAWERVFPSGGAAP
ncbi:hypothetical protein MO973_26920 [Paenibacillus sp. TRM 82003]|nr:hypothetical protein [Paenibacillus sp. TRM 82003]